MADITTPNNPNQPNQPPVKGDVSSLANPNTLSNLNNSKDPKAFGDQAKNMAKAAVITTATQSPIAKLYKEKALLIEEGIQLDIKHQLTLFKLDQEHKKYQKLQKESNTGQQENLSNSSTPSQLTPPTPTPGIPPYTYKIFNSKGKTEIRIYDSTNAIVIDFIWGGIYNFTEIDNKVTTITKDLKTSGNNSSYLQDKSYLIHIYKTEDQISISQGLSDEEYQIAVINENGGTLPNGKIVEGNYPASKKNLDERKKKNQKSIDDYLKDPFKKIKDAKKKLKAKLKKGKTKTKSEKRKARKAQIKAILSNAKKNLGPIVALLLTSQLINIVSQNDKIGKLVADTNAIIEDANESQDPLKLNNAQIARDNALRIIQDNEDKIQKILKLIETIEIFITIFSLLISILEIALNVIPLPIPPPIIKTILLIIEKINKILLIISAILPVIISALSRVIDILEDYKSQLLEINTVLEDSAANGDIDSKNSENGGIKVGIIEGEVYKGFKFAIREDNSFGGVHVGNFKRHYATAIDKNNVDVLKSELSFTLDPDDLISQLKLVIDQQNLIA